LRLYIVPGAPNSLAAKSNLADILAPLRASEYTVEIVDCLADPRRALADGVIVTPTLVKTSPPGATIVGSLSDRARVISALGLDTVEARVGDA
jgi:circadian clock protein KaiB